MGCSGRSRPLVRTHSSATSMLGLPTCSSACVVNYEKIVALTSQGDVSASSFSKLSEEELDATEATLKSWCPTYAGKCMASMKEINDAGTDMRGVTVYDMWQCCDCLDELADSMNETYETCCEQSFKSTCCGQSEKASCCECPY